MVDDHGELLWRLRALYALKNLLGKRIVAVGGPGGWGADGAEAPKQAQDLWKLDIRTVSYPELGERIQKARQNQALVDRCRGEAEKYLMQQGTYLRHVVLVGQAHTASEQIAGVGTSPFLPTNSVTSDRVNSLEGGASG